MMKYRESRDSVSTELLLWQEKTTQISIRNVYDIKVRPTSSSYNEGALYFDIPPQQTGMLSNVEIVTKFKIKKGAGKLVAADNCSVINNFANSLFELVQVRVGDRVELMQSMRNSYAYQTFFDYCLNSHPDRADYLFSTQLFKMDSGTTKTDAESTVFTGDNVVNLGASERAKRIAESKSVTVRSRLHCPLLTSSKALPSNIKIHVALTKNSDKFLLITDVEGCRVEIEDIFLEVTYIRPTDIFHNLIENRLRRQPIPYFISKPELIIKPISVSGRIARINQIFPGKIPRHAFFVVQRSSDFEGSYDSNGFAFQPYKQFSLSVNGEPLFADPLEINYQTKDGERIYGENGQFLQTLYKVIGKYGKSACLINSDNFQQNFMVGVSFAGDRSSTKSSYLSPQTHASTELTIDFGYDTNVSHEFLLLVYAVHDSLVKIDSTRSIEIID